MSGYFWSRLPDLQQTSMRLLGTAVGAGVIGVFGFCQGRAIAQVGLSPMLIQAEMEQGPAQQNMSRTVNVQNPSNETVRVQMYAEPFTYDRMNGFVLLDENSRDLSRDLTPHLQFSPREFVLMPKAEQQVQVLGSLPPMLTETEYRAVILAESSPEGSTASRRDIVETRIGSTVYLRQPAAEPSFSIVSAQWDAFDQQAQLLVRNIGEATARPNARWIIKRNDEVVATGQSGATTVIEGGDRLIPLPYFNESGVKLTPGQYKISGTLTWRFEEEQMAQPFEETLLVQ